MSGLVRNDVGHAVSGNGNGVHDEYAESVAAGEVGGRTVRVLPPRKLGNLRDERGGVGRDAADGSSGRGQIFRVVAGVGGDGLDDGARVKYTDSIKPLAEGNPNESRCR